ncbi:MAG: hypothetical protein Q9184_006535 [Pyrenodesmia sp. 2 TL-2023]
MATATAVHLDFATPNSTSAFAPDFPPPAESKDTVLVWAKALREGFGRLFVGQLPEKVCYHAPRRRSRDPEETAMAESIADLIYPTASEYYSPQMRDQGSWKMLSLPIQKYVRVARQEKVARQGSQTEDMDPASLTGASAQPMPVKVSQASQLAPFFNHLSSGGGS